MNRYILTIEGYKIKPRIYAKSDKEAARKFSKENVLNIEKDTDTTYLNYISEIKARSQMVKQQEIKNNDAREIYQCQLDDGKLIIRLYLDKDDNTYFDIAEYKWFSKDSMTYPIGFTYSSPEEVWDLFFSPFLTCEIPIYRFYGQPKMDKPKELKGNKSCFSVDWIPKKCTCQCYINGGDLWIKHRDFFSATHKPEPCDIGTPLSYRLKKYFGKSASNEKFIYADNWGSIVLRNEAWIVFRNFKHDIAKNKFLTSDSEYSIKHYVSNNMKRAFLLSDFAQKLGIYELEDNWDRFFESICKQYLLKEDKCNV